MRQVALVTAARLPVGMEDTPGLMSRLRSLGATPTVVQWSSTQVRWHNFDRVLLHSPWDYSTRLHEFVGWLGNFKNDSRLVNPHSLVSWNLDKRYLIDLRERGVALPATRAENAGRNFTEAALDELASGLPLVIKPAVGAGGTRTYRRSSAAEAMRLIHDEMPDEPVLVQQYESAIETMGEYSVIYLGNSVSHVIRKIPSGQEFRVQSQHGGTIVRESIKPWMDDYAHFIIGNLPAQPSYARLDFIIDEAKTTKLMEIEVAEPDLFLRYEDKSYAALADAILGDA